MPAHLNPFDAEDAVRRRASQDDPWVMYYVVRKNVRMSFGQALALGGAGAVGCADLFRHAHRWRERFAAWEAESYRKVALRADDQEFAAVSAELPAFVCEAEGVRRLLCLPPQRKSERGVSLSALPAFTDARLPADDPAPAPGPALVYVVRPAVLKSMGKAIAQAGHAALMCADMLADSYAPEFAAWRAAGMPGEARLASDDVWERLKSEVDCVVVKDAGFTQVAPGTETVLCLPPRVQPPLVTSLPLVP